MNTSYAPIRWWTPAVKNIVIANVIIFVLQFLLNSSSVSSTFFQTFALWPFDSGKFMLWQPISSMFMHAGIGHLFWNMIAFWLFGRDLEDYWGTKRFYFYYFMCGIGAAFISLIVNPLFGPDLPSVGASGAIFGILVAFGFLFPNVIFYLYFIIPVKAKYLILAYVGWELYSAFTSVNSGISHFAHLGGAFIGIVYLLIKYKTNLTTDSPFAKKYNTDVDPLMIGIQNDLPEEEPEIVENIDESLDDFDKILEKISEQGINSLTEKEREILREESKNQ